MSDSMKKSIRIGRIIKRTSVFLLLLLFLLSCGCENNPAVSLLERDDWNDDVKTAVNDFIGLYGSTSVRYSKNSYVVSDFDNTASIFDMCEQFVIYQAEVMGYGFTPEALPEILSSGLGDMDEDLSRFGYGNGSYRDWISDIVAAYTYLYAMYGPFSGAGLNEESSAKIRNDPMWAEFIAKMMNLYKLIGDNESTDVSYPWITYWFTGMTEDEVYTLARASYAKYRTVDTSVKTIRSSDTADSRVGAAEYTYTEGIQVTENTLELWKALNRAGIDVWVCTASECDIIRAAVDEFGLHDYCSGLLGMTPSRVDGKLSCTYDYVSGYAWYPAENGEWNRGNVATGAQTQGEGKVLAIQNVCVKSYGCGPLAGFMDSTGDYNFCTEFADLKLVICFNRADRKVTDGGAVIAELAEYQNNVLGYNLKKANENGDTYYVLQGRDENGTRSLRNSDRTLKYEKTEEILYRDEQNEAEYDFMLSHRLSTGEILRFFAMRTEKDAENNPLGFTFGFLVSYDGYHSK